MFTEPSKNVQQWEEAGCFWVCQELQSVFMEVNMLM